MSDDDPFLWLEEVEGERPLEWVRRENARSIALLEADPRYRTLHDQALAIVTASDRIPYPRFLGERLANFWQDEAHVRGLWRETGLTSFLTSQPEWQTVLDIDALAAVDGRNWVYQGGSVLPPDYRHALVSLSDGGKDAHEVREFDIAERRFVEAGFRLPEGKQSAGWLDQDTLIVGRDWGPGTMTKSGYPFVLKTWRRASALADAAEMFRGSEEDVSVGAGALRDPDGTVRGILINRQLNFFESERYLAAPAGALRLDLPAKASFRGFVAGQMVFSLEEAWREFPAGALISLDLDACKANPMELHPVLVFAPGPREAIEDIATTRHFLLATIYRNVQGRAVAFRFAAGAWTAQPIPLPAQASVSLVATNDRDDRAFIDVAGFLTPNTLYLAEPGGGAPAPVKSLPPRFDAAVGIVEQFEANSADGTLVPYFVMRPLTMPLDGTNPTLLYGYGGFQVSMNPAYAPIAGKLWLERGGVYVVANIRGGGEFGPAWHQAALKENRRRAFEDFIAVAEDLIRRGITSPRRLGIMGGSNGGLLMGAMLTMRPELFRAVVIQVPLLDMLRFHKLLAGASWIAEYGDPDRPEEAAFLRSISPYHNLRAGAPYPEPFFVTSTKDDRVHPGHARKMAAKMAAADLPFLYYENVEGGHSAAANLEERARRHALEFSYLSQKLMD